MWNNKKDMNELIEDVEIKGEPSFGVMFGMWFIIGVCIFAITRMWM
jgi:hypothetical protein